MTLVVSDTSPIRALAHLGHVALLRDLYGQVLVPPAVQNELSNPPGASPPVDVTQLDFVVIQVPQDQARVQQLLLTLDQGESEALALAVEVRATAVLIDEAAGRDMARQLGLVAIGVLGVLLRAKQRGLIPAVGPLMDRLEGELNFFIAADLRAEVLRQAGE